MKRTFVDAGVLIAAVRMHLRGEQHDYCEK